MHSSILALVSCAALLISCDRHQSSRGQSKAFSGPRDYIEKYVPSDAVNVVTSEVRDDFFGDGELWEVYELSPDQSKNFKMVLLNETEWKPLPLTRELEKLSFAYNADLPYDAKDGFYFFHDFQPDWYPSEASNSKPVWDRPSVNFVIMIYIPTEGRIYIDNQDT